LSILLVEDHEASLAVMTRLLRLLGHNVVAANTVATAVAAANQDAFDVVISDLGLPDGSGLARRWPPPSLECRERPDEVST
jgi:CheY-like chemotaxis protein